MEINITNFFNTAAPMDYSAGLETWQAALNDSADCMMLDDDEKREAFRQHVKGFGAWSDEKIAAWSDVELNALFIQFVAGDMRGADLTPTSDDADWIDYQARAEAGQCSGNIFRSADNLIYYYIGD